MRGSLKYCGKCHIFKPRSEFTTRRASADGLNAVCKSCARKYQIWYRSKYPRTAEQKAKQRVYNLQYRAKRRTVINANRRQARREQKRIDTIRIRFNMSEAQHGY